MTNGPTDQQNYGWTEPVIEMRGGKMGMTNESITMIVMITLSLLSMLLTQAKPLIDVLMAQWLSSSADASLCISHYAKVAYKEPNFLNKGS